jgi:hypothetical protein
MGNDIKYKYLHFLTMHHTVTLLRIFYWLQARSKRTSTNFDIIWDNISQELTQRVENIQIEALRCATGITISAIRQSLYTETGLLPLEKRRKLLQRHQYTIQLTL